MFEPAYLRGETWGLPGAAVTHIETHAAHVFLAGERAFKIKKPVKLPYLDFSTRDKRQAVLERELEINRQFALHIYERVGEVRGEPVLVMKRFATRDILLEQVTAGQISDALALALAGMAAAAHAAAPAAETAGAPIMAGLGAQLSAAFTASHDIFPGPETLEFHALYEEALHRLSRLLNQRSEQGLVRRCHGDMHCGNIAVIDGKPTLFDAIEFSEKIATIDVLYDLAFLLMDLMRHGQRRAANLVFNRYLDLRRGVEDLAGLAALPLFMATRAGVRALVTADLIRSLPLGASLRERGEALDYFRASIAYLKPERPLLVAVGGLSGSGKSTLAASLAAAVGTAPGALHARSDIERKRLAQVAETERLPSASYTREASVAVYDALLARAGAALAAGCSVVIDAVFSAPAERAQAEMLAGRHNVKFCGLWLDAPAEMLKARVAARRNDASDADAEVIEHQLGYDLGAVYWPRIDASSGPAAVLAAARRKLPPRSGGPA